ncbi:MAG: formate dehydrogenase accessory protein FdhE [Piscinibacter sp.]|uniref:formate dehydrogenase accessory protein FdhE n=1 Tax=Piscinibacter sp. TaxID=1903157 RepID=UPI003D13344F
MTTAATVRVMTPEEIAARAGGEMAFLHPPQRGTVFAERAMRLRQLARGHAMWDYLLFMADLAQAQQDRLEGFPSVPLPDGDALDRAAKAGLPPLPAVDWPRDPVWHGVAKVIAADLRGSAPAGAQAALERIARADTVWFERQADGLLTGVMEGLDLATAPVVAAALQVYWTHMVTTLLAQAGARGAPFGRTDDETTCPCCGRRPTASITRSSGESLGQRYLHCSLCGMQWHMVRIKCPSCLSTKSLAYHSLDAAGSSEDGASRAAGAALQAESCDDCSSYLKIMHTDRDPFMEPAADDLASVTLDLLVSEAGFQRHGVNLMLLFGAPEAPSNAPPDAPSP